MNEENPTSEEIKKEQREKMKNMLVDSIWISLLPPNVFYKCHLAKNSDIPFENYMYNDNNNDKEDENDCSLDQK